MGPTCWHVAFQYNLGMQHVSYIDGCKRDYPSGWLAQSEHASLLLRGCGLHGEVGIARGGSGHEVAAELL